MRLHGAKEQGRWSAHPPACRTAINSGQVASGTRHLQRRESACLEGSHDPCLPVLPPPPCLSRYGNWPLGPHGAPRHSPSQLVAGTRGGVLRRDCNPHRGPCIHPRRLTLTHTSTYSLL